MYFGWIPYLEPSQQCVVDLQLSRYHVHHAITGAKKRAVNRFAGFDTNRASGHLTQSNICAESTLMGRCAFTSILLVESKILLVTAHLPMSVQILKASKNAAK